MPISSKRESEAKSSLAGLAFLFAVLTLPLQLSKFFWPNYSYVLGIPIDYRSLAIYANELSILFFILVFLIQNRSQLKNIFGKNKEQIVLLSAFNIWIFTTSFLFSKFQWASLVFNLRLAVISIFFIFALNILKNSEVRKKLISVLIFSVAWQTAIVLYQLIFQKSLGAWFLGERSFDSSTTLIAHFNLFGRQLLRPYGTFPHPNALAAFFAISLLTLMNQKRLLLPKILALAGGLLTFSKSFILSLLLSPAPYFLKARYVIFLPFISILIWLIAAYTFHFQIASFSERLLLIQASVNLSRDNFLFGSGSNNFIAQLANFNLFSVSEIRLLQPVHNVFFLILVENGIGGLLIFILFLMSLARNLKNTSSLAIFVTLMIFASLDHFFWTLAQGRFLFFLSLAYIASAKKK